MSLPGVLGEIAEVAGVDAAWALAQSYGGTTIYIPAHARPDHWLSRLVGQSAAVKICDHFRVNRGGARVLVPLARQGQQQRRLAAALENNATVTEAALASGMHERTVYRAKKRLKRRDASARKDDRQSELF